MKNTEEITTEIAIVDKETVENLIYVVRTFYIDVEKIDIKLGQENCPLLLWRLSV